MSFTKTRSICDKFIIQTKMEIDLVGIVLILLQMPCTLPAIEASSDEFVLNAMLMQKLHDSDITKKGKLNDVEYMKIDAIPASSLERNREQMFGLLNYAIFFDWELRLKSKMNKKQSLLYYYSHPWESESNTMLLIAIFRRSNQRWEEVVGERVFDDTEAGVMYKENLWRAQFVRMLRKKGQIVECILSFAVVAKENTHTHEFVSKNIAPYVWPEARFEYSKELRMHDSQERLMRMMVDGEYVDASVATIGTANGVSYKKIAVTRPIHFNAQHISKLLHEAILNTWEHTFEELRDIKSDAVSPTHQRQIRSFSHYAWSKTGMRIVIAIARTFTHNPASIPTSEESREFVNEFTPLLNKGNDTCQTMLKHRPFNQITWYNGQYVRISIKDTECVVSFIIVKCPRHNSLMGETFKGKPFKLMLWNAINNVCPTNKLTYFYPLEL